MLLIVLQTTLSWGAMLLVLLMMMVILVAVVTLLEVMLVLIVPRQKVVAWRPSVGIGSWPRRFKLVLHAVPATISSSTTSVLTVSERIHSVHATGEFFVAAHGASQFSPIILGLTCFGGNRSEKCKSRGSCEFLRMLFVPLPRPADIIEKPTKVVASGWPVSQLTLRMAIVIYLTDLATDLKRKSHCFLLLTLSLTTILLRS